MGSTPHRAAVEDIGGEGSAGLALLFREHRDRLRAVVAMRLEGKLAQKVDASDIIQETFVEAVERYEQYQKDRREDRNPGLTPYLWLRFLAVQRLKLLHRRHVKTKKRAAGREAALAAPAGSQVTSAGLADFLIATNTTPTRAAARAEALEQLRAALDRLDQADREVLALRHFEHLSNEEAATVLEIQPAAASQRYYRALKRLKELVLPVLEEVTRP